MGDRDRYAGTGDPLLEFGPFTIADDGDPDHYVDIRVTRLEYDGDTYKSLEDLRETAYLNKDDFREVLAEAFAEYLDSAPGSNPRDAPATYYPPKPVAGKCPGCNLTYPRSMTNDAGECVGCADE